jgi:hypothetical protein
MPSIGSLTQSILRRPNDAQMNRAIEMLQQRATVAGPLRAWTEATEGKFSLDQVNAGLKELQPNAHLPTSVEEAKVHVSSVTKGMALTIRAYDLFDDLSGLKKAFGRTTGKLVETEKKQIDHCIEQLVPARAAASGCQAGAGRDHR